MRIALGSDHGGFELKEALKGHLLGLGHAVTDLGTASKEPVDYPVFARAVALRVALGRMLEDPALRVRFGRAGRTAYEDRFSIQQMLAGTAAVYSELARKEGLPRVAP